VTLVVRAESLEEGMSHYLVRQVEATPNISVRVGTEVVGGGGDGWFAAGDVRHGSMNRVASAVGEGSIAIKLVHELFATEQLHPRDLV
jgi:thioredoxin reductase